MAFYIFDFISTFLFCPNPDEEAGPIPHFFMKLTNSVLGGLTLNILFSATFWAIFMFGVYPYVLKYIKTNQVRKLESFLFILLGVFPSFDFAGATSWYLQIPIFSRMLIGLMIYLSTLIWVKPSEKSH
jgi:hypothetical protein